MIQLSEVNTLPINPATIPPAKQQHALKAHDCGVDLVIPVPMQRTYAR